MYVSIPTAWNINQPCSQGLAPLGALWGGRRRSLGARLYLFLMWMWNTLSALTVQLFLMWRVYKKSNTKHLLQIKTAIYFWLVVCDLNHFLETPYTAIVVSSNVTPCWRYEGSRSRVRQICKVFIGRLWNTKWRNGEMAHMVSLRWPNTLFDKCVSFTFFSKNPWSFGHQKW